MTAANPAQVVSEAGTVGKAAEEVAKGWTQDLETNSMLYGLVVGMGGQASRPLSEADLGCGPVVWPAYTNTWEWTTESSCGRQG